MEETCGAEEFLCFHTAAVPAVSVASGIGAEAPKGAKNAFQPGQLLDLE